MAELTPMMRQYMDVKEQNPDSLLFFRLGDFYEMFGADARTASQELDLALTTRDKDKTKAPEDKIPMCGIPYHSADAYIARLIAKGYKVSICEQTEDPALAKGLVQREVIRTVTPGTVLDDACLDAGRSNYLCGVYLSDTAAGLCACDVSTGQAHVTVFTGEQRITGLINELGRFAPAEAVMNAAAYDNAELAAALENRFACRRERLGDGRYDLRDAEKKVRTQFGEEALSRLPRNDAAPLLAPAANPRLLHFEEPVKNLGKVAETDGTVKLRFEYTNIADREVTLLDVHTQCGCARPEFSRKPVKPGDKGIVEVTFDPKDRYGDFSIGLTVIAGNGNYRKFNTLVVKGYVISRIPEAEIRYPYALSAALRADNRAIGMRQLSRSDPKRTRQLRLLNTSAKTLRLAYRTDSGHLALSGPGEIAPGKEAVLEFTLDPRNMPDGQFVLKCTVSTQDEEIPVEVKGQIVGR